MSASNGTGPAGPAGDEGREGAPGREGPRGRAGATGASGATGTTGAIGSTGATGSAGAKGTTGEKGATGDENPKIAVGLRQVAEAMDALAKSNTALAENFARGRRQFRVQMVVLGVLLLSLVVNGIATHSVLNLSRTINAQTSPAATQANREKLIQVEQLVIGCANNHVDRQVDVLTHQAKITPLRPGCPPDSVKAP